MSEEDEAGRTGGCEGVAELSHSSDGEILNEHGRQLLGWDEILEGGLAPRATVMSWRGEEGGIKAAKAGHDVIMTPGGFCYLDSYQDAPTTQPEAIGGYLTLEKVYFYDPIPEVLTKEGADYIQGVQANVWAEYITTAEHMEYMVYPRLLALAEVAWTQPDKKNWEHFHRCALKEVKWLQDNGYHPFDLSKEVGERPEAAVPVEHLGLMKTIKYTSPYAPQYTAGEILLWLTGFVADGRTVINAGRVSSIRIWILRSIWVR